MSLSIVILAAGRGSRFLSKMPKALATIGGAPMIKHIIDKSNKICENVFCVLSSNILEDYINKLNKSTNA